MSGVFCKCLQVVAGMGKQHAVGAASAAVPSLRLLPFEDCGLADPAVWLLYDGHFHVAIGGNRLPIRRRQFSRPLADDFNGVSVDAL